MSDFLVKQAIQNIWCTPSQDKQNIIKLAKISRYGGEMTKVDVFWRQYQLPKARTLYHCYQSVDVSPSKLGLTVPPAPGVWLNVAEACGSGKSIIDLYNLQGVQSPRFLAWYMVTRDNALVFAVERQDKIAINYNDEPLFLRIYNNAYYGTDRHDPNTEFIEVRGKVTYDMQDVLQIQNDYLVAKMQGHTYAFVNGRMVQDITPFTVTPGDVVEYIYDGSIYAVEDFLIGNLGVFDSLLDLKRKYLLHSSQAIKTTITYHDDIDFYVMKKDANGAFQALYLHRNTPSVIRQLTHADYSISIPFLDAFVNTDEGWDNLNDLTVRAILRKSGWRRSLMFETNRIAELYKLPDADILGALIGVNATVPEWTAAHLEAASYPKVMSALRPGDLTPALVQDMFGYNSMSQQLGFTPQFSQNVNGQVTINIPLNLQYRSTVYEFDFDGKLLGWHLHPLGPVWVAQHSDCHMVQIVSGYATTQLDEVYGKQGATLNPTQDYRMYTCGMFSGMPDNLWQDVTDGPAYIVNNGNLTWLTEPHTTFTMVRSNRDFLGYDVDIPVHAGVLRMALSSLQDRGHGLVNTLMQVEMGELDLWLNGNALVEEIDYIVSFPEIVIISKRYIDPEQVSQRITVRFSGLANANMKRAVLGDRGFISHGVLSNNNRFDIRDDKVLHIAIGGGVYDRTELSFAETHSGVNVPGVPNGAPYVVRDIVVPMRGTTNAKTYELRNAALVTDKHVSDYLTLRLPPPTFTELSPIENLYPVYSPFISALLDDLKTGILDDPRIEGTYNDDTLRQMVQQYEQLLEFEPTRAPHKADTNYVSVQPYYADEVVDLNIFQYRFVSRVVSLYLNNAVSLSHFVRAVA
jgi:hypothetical protein